MSETESSIQGLGHHGIQTYRSIIIVAACIIAIAFFGALKNVDRYLLGAVSTLKPQLSMENAPVLFTIDQQSIEYLGMPPWTVDKWTDISKALKKIGINEAYLVEPYEKLLNVNEKSTTYSQNLDSMVKIWIPKILLDPPGMQRSLFESSLKAPINPFYPWAYQLYLPTNDNGIVLGISEDSTAKNIYGTSAFCSWSKRCPEGKELSRILVPPKNISPVLTISIRDILSGRVDLGTGSQTKRVSLIGITHPLLTDFVHVGPLAVKMTRAESIALATSVLTDQTKTPFYNQYVDIIILIAILLVASIVYRFLNQLHDIWFIILFPAVASIIGILLFFGNIIIPPLSAMILISCTPPLVASFGSRGVTITLLRDVARVIYREGFRYSPKGTQIKTHQELLLKLGALSRNYTSEGHCIYFKTTKERDSLEFIGGFGLTDSDLKQTNWSKKQPPFSLAIHNKEGYRSDNLLKKHDVYAWIIPIFQGNNNIGFWCISLKEDDMDPDVRLLSNLATWLSLHINMEEGSSKKGLQGYESRSVDPLERELEIVQELFLATSEERHRQLETLVSLNHPILVADISGTVLFQNRAMNELIYRSNFGSVRSIRELIFKLSGESELDKKMSQLCRLGSTLAFSWTDTKEHAYEVSIYPIREESGFFGLNILGYVAQFEDVSITVQLKKLRSKVLSLTTIKLRDELMVVMSGATMLKFEKELSNVQGIADDILLATTKVGNALDELKSVIGFEEDLHKEIFCDFIEIIKESVKYVEDLAETRKIKFLKRLPDISLPVKTIPTAAQQQLTHILKETCSLAPEGGVVEIVMDERAERTAIIIRWAGFGFDEHFLKHVQPETNILLDEAMIPQEMKRLLQARTIFPNLRIEGEAGRGVAISFMLSRGSAT